jgi:3-oxoadipate CoA-transferase, beta subunit
VTPLTREQIAARAARDIREGEVVNVGIGLPTLVPPLIPEDREVIFQSENGIVGMGGAPAPDQVDSDLINAGKQFTTLRRGGAFIHHNDAFLMIRGGHIDVALMGAFQVSVDGDLANWSTERADFAPAVGGAMDLAAGAKQVRILMEHVTRDGQARLVRRCTLPLTAPKCVSRIYTTLAVMDVDPSQQALVVREIVPGMSLADLQAVTDAPLVASVDCTTLALTQA